MAEGPAANVGVVDHLSWFTNIIEGPLPRFLLSHIIYYSWLTQSLCPRIDKVGSQEKGAAALATFSLVNLVFE